MTKKIGITRENIQGKRAQATGACEQGQLIYIDSLYVCWYLTCGL